MKYVKMVLSLQRNSVLIESIAGTSKPQEIEVNAMLQPMKKRYTASETRL